jgi:hypothetical protein
VENTGADWFEGVLGDRGPPKGAAGCPRSPASHGYRTACPVRDEASTPRLLLASISLDTLQQRFTALGIGPNGRTGVNDLQHVDWQACPARFSSFTRVTWLHRPGGPQQVSPAWTATRSVLAAAQAVVGGEHS